MSCPRCHGFVVQERVDDLFDCAQINKCVNCGNRFDWLTEINKVVYARKRDNEVVQETQVA